MAKVKKLKVVETFYNFYTLFCGYQGNPQAPECSTHTERAYLRRVLRPKLLVELDDNFDANLDVLLVVHLER